MCPGHIFGDRFGGSPELDNLVSQSSKVNLSTFKKLENKWAKALNQNQI
ncbi:DNA/RNA non-specific endonuclease [Capnocytophaga canimorsus]